MSGKIIEVDLFPRSKEQNNELQEACHGIANSIHNVGPDFFLSQLKGKENSSFRLAMDNPAHPLTSLLTIEERTYIKKVLKGK